MEKMKSYNSPDINPDDSSDAKEEEEPSSSSSGHSSSSSDSSFGNKLVCAECNEGYELFGSDCMTCSVTFFLLF